jgi:hypothetical protein
MDKYNGLERRQGVDLNKVYCEIVEIKADVKTICKKNDDYDKTLYGNGQKGLKERVVGLEHFKAVCLFIITPIAAAVLGGIGYGLVAIIASKN